MLTKSLQNLLLRDIKLMKGKALRKHSLYEKTAASVFIEAVHQ